MTTHEIHWLSGLLEGEGTFVTQSYGQPRITLVSTDLDIVERGATLLGAKRVKLRNSKRWGKKPQHECSVYSRQAASWLMTLYILMGQRRKEQFRRVLAAWKAH